jgi:hypothetical protein
MASQAESLQQLMDFFRVGGAEAAPRWTPHAAPARPKSAPREFVPPHVPAGRGPNGSADAEHGFTRF